MLCIAFARMAAARPALARAVLASLALALSPLAAAQAPAAFPNKPMRLIVPFAAGSGTDAVARIVGQQLGERLKQPVVVENRPGANGQIGIDALLKSPADGYTLLMSTNTAHSANPSLYRKLPYDPIRDFTPIARTGELPFLLAVSPEVPARNLQELIAHAKANPGKLSYATPNSTSLVVSETLKRLAGIDIVGVPYKSSPQALTDTAGGQIQIYVTDVASGMAALRSGKVRPIAVAADRRYPLFPDVPPMAATVPGIDIVSWNGVFGPAGMPKPVTDQLAAALTAVLAQPDVVAKLGGIGFVVWPSASADEFAKYVADQLGLWTRLIRDAGIPAE